MDSLYSDDAPEASAQDSDAQNPQHSEEGQTALIPKSLLAGKDCKPGDVIKMKIVRFTNDEAEVAYSDGEESEQEESAEPPEQQTPAEEAGEESMYS